MDVYWALLAVICVERVCELVVSTRHANASLGRGGLESGAGHFPVMVILHFALLVGCVVEPLAGSAWITACAFTVLNAALLTVRLRCETRALAAATG
jgi:methyltransferase